MFDSTFPIITTPDLARSLSFYCDLLEGNVVYQYPPEGKPEYAGVDLGMSHILLGEDPQLADDRRPQRISLWVYTTDCNAAIEKLRAAGTPIVEEPSEQQLGELVASVNDPDGNLVVIGQRAPIIER